MNSSNFGKILIVIGLVGLGWAGYSIVADSRVTPANCGVTVAPVTTPVIMTAETMARVPMKLVNRSGRPIRIVGADAC